MTDLALVTAGKIGVTFAQQARIRTVLPAVTLTPGEVFYFNANGKGAKSDADAVETARFHGLYLDKTGSFVSHGEVGGFDLSGLAYGAKVHLSATAGKLCDTDPGVNEVQTVTLSGSPTGGNFTLTFAGQTTGNIAHNAAAAAVEAALEALSTIGAGNARVTGNAGGPYSVEFIGELGKQNVAAMTADGSGLTGGTAPAVAVAEATAGVSSVAVATVVPITDRDMTKVLFFDGMKE